MNLDDHYRCYAAADKTDGNTTIYNVKGEMQTAPLNALSRGIYVGNGTTIVKQ